MQPTDLIQSPATLLDAWRGRDGLSPELHHYEAWWREEGEQASRAVDRQGTPPLQVHDRWGNPVDRVEYIPEYRRMLVRGYATGIVARAADERSLLPGYRLGHVTAFFDSGLYCPYTVSLGTLVPVLKYAPQPLRERFMPALTGRDDAVWQGATWMTEAGGGSDIGHQVHTRAREVEAGLWRLDGEKYFCSNVDAELAVVAARPEDASGAVTDGVRGLALFLVPRRRADGSLNVRIRRLKDKIATRSVPTGEVTLAASEGWLLGQAEQGIYLIMEVLNTSRVANSVGSAALMQRALAEALVFAEQREVFTRRLVDQPLFARQLETRIEAFRGCFALAWEAADLLEGVWLETPPYSPDHALFRLVAHLAKFHTAEQAIETARWAMEVHGGAGALHEYAVERLLREAVILSIWEGTPHRQMLDGLEVMAKTGAHEQLFAHLGEPAGSDALRARMEGLLATDADTRAGDIEPIFRDLARWTAEALAERRLPPA